MITYDSGANGHYLCKANCINAGLPILKPSIKCIGIANGTTSHARHVSRLPFSQLSPSAVHADSFPDFPQSLMSVCKTCDNGTIFIFTQNGVLVHAKRDILITCKGVPLLIGTLDEHGRYRIPLIQHKGHWQPRTLSLKAYHALCQANSVYNLPTTKQAIKCLYAVCGYPVESTWIKAVQAGNFIGWPLLTARNAQK